MENKDQVMAYSEMFNFFLWEHGLTLTNSEMDDIINQVELFKGQFNGDKKTDTSTSSETTY